MSDKLFSIHADGSVLKSGKPAVCPYKTPIPVKQSIQSNDMAFAMQPCTVHCAMCTIAQDDGKENPDNKGEWYIQLTCGCAPVGGYIDMPEENVQKKTGLLTSV